MKKEDILEISRKEHQNRDLAELEISSQAGNIAGRVGALMCCLISLAFHRVTGTPLFSPWIIYFSILGTNYLVKYVKVKRKTDLILTILFYAICLLALIFFVKRLVEVRA